MPTYTELLPPSKSNPHRCLKYTPACRGVGVLEITDGRSHTRYALAVQPFGGVRLTKAGGVETYVVTRHRCECKGSVFGRNGVRCKHWCAIEALHANGWLDHDGEPAEVCEDNSPDRADDDEHAEAVGQKLLSNATQGA